MRVVVLSEFHDKHQFSRIYKVGEVLEFTDERSQDLLARGLAKAAEQEKKDEAPKSEEATNVEPADTTPADEKAQSEAKAEEAIKKARKAIKSSKK